MTIIKKTPHAGKDVEKRETSHTVVGTVNWYSHCGKHYGGFLKTKNRTTIWPSNSAPGYISEKTPKTLIQKDTYTPMFIATLFTICKLWKQPKCPSTNELIKKRWYIHKNGILLSHKKGWNFAICNNMDGLRGYYAKWNRQREKNAVWYHLYVESKKHNKIANITKKKLTHRYREQTSGSK